jgi:hypothetical protein
MTVRNRRNPHTVGGQIRITDQPPLIFHPKIPGAAAALDKLFHAYRQSLSDDRRMLFDRYRLVDVAVKAPEGTKPLDI